MFKSQQEVCAYLDRMERSFDKDPAIGQEWAKMNDLYSRKLWHQLSLLLLEVIKKKENKPFLQDMYKNFIQDFELKINAMHLVEIYTIIGNGMDSPDETLAFLMENEPRVKASFEAYTLWKIRVGEVKLMKNDLEGCHESLNEIEEVLSETSGIILSIHTPYYSLQSEWNKKSGNITEYYKFALLYLGCAKLIDIPTEQQLEYGKHLVVAGIVSPDIYSFGDLLLHPVLNPLIHSKHSWLVELLAAFNSGNIQKFEELKKYWSRVDMLKGNKDMMVSKISILSVMELCFSRPANQRTLTFKEIAEVACVELNQVEILIMKANANGLIKSSIDEIDQTVSVSWVLPRILDKEQIGKMLQRIDQWREQVDAVVELTESFLPPE